MVSYDQMPSDANNHLFGADVRGEQWVKLPSAITLPLVTTGKGPIVPMPITGALVDRMFLCLILYSF
jgi:hypothetical protein